MKKLLLLGAASAALLCAGPAFAGPTATSTVNISGTSPTVCTLDTNPVAGTTSGSGATFVLGSNNLNVSSLFDTTDAHVHAGSIVLNYNGMCNYAHFAGIKSGSGAMVQTSPVTPVGGTFVRRVGYAGTFTWGPTSVAPTSPLADNTSTGSAAAPGAQTAVSAQVGGADAGVLAVTLTFADNAAPAVSGDYADTLTVQLGVTL